LRRRELLAFAALAAALPHGIARSASPRRPRVACLSDEDEPRNASLRRRVVAGLASAGVHDVELRIFPAANDELETVTRTAREAIAWQPDVILAPGPINAMAARDATRTIPIVFFAVPDPPAFGLVKSLARPEGNITGSGLHSAATSFKRIELVRELLPRARRVASLYRWTLKGGEALLAKGKRQFADDAERLGFQVEDAEVGVGGRGLKATLEALGRRPPDAVLPFASFAWEPDGTQPDVAALLVGFEKRHRVPVVSEYRYLVEAGAVAAMYDVGSQLGEAIAILARVLKGTPVREIPIALPVRYHLAVNPKAASAIGLTIPPAVMLRADRIIE
jgi:putative ABC transport system substrate-binding protein